MARQWLSLGLLLAAAGAVEAACVVNPEGVLGDVAALGGCKRCDDASENCAECQPFFHLTPDGACELDGCVEAPDGIEGAASGLGGCKLCADDTTCAECWPFFGLAANGTCVECDPGRTEHLACTSCLGDDPSFCTDCSDSMEGGSDSGYYATPDGRCALCPAEDCVACESLNGTCTVCKQGFGLMPDGSCQPCDAGEECTACDGDPARCTSCFSGYFADPGTGSCQECPPNCELCSSADECQECSSWGFTLNADSGMCVPCSKGCTSCPDGPEQCAMCDSGYANVTGGGCAPCLDPHCSMCEAGVDVCTVCDDQHSRYGVNPATGGCVKCAVPHCANCQPDASACQWCSDGHWRDENSGLCEKCQDNCARCHTNGSGEQECDACAQGFEFDDESSSSRSCVRVAPQDRAAFAGSLRRLRRHLRL